MTRRPRPSTGDLHADPDDTQAQNDPHDIAVVVLDHGPSFHYADVRYVATGGLLAVNPSWLRISMNPARGDGGTCHGDSGGPNLLGAAETGTNIVGAITITGDAMCRATNVDYRLDTPSARAFLSQYVTLPENAWWNDCETALGSVMIRAVIGGGGRDSWND